MKNILDRKIVSKFLPFLIFLFALTLRVYGINWDQNQHLHPDERFLTMVTTGVAWPKNLTEYFDTDLSPLNPHNMGFNFYVYGTTPLFIAKAFADAIQMTDYNALTIAGRVLSAIIDSVTAFLVYLITLKIINKRSFALLGMFFYGAAVLPIQISHYYTVDPFTTFFIALSFYFLLFVKEATGYGEIFLTVSRLAVSFSLAFASKIQAVFFLPILSIGLFVYTFKKGFVKFLYAFFVFGFISLLAVRVAQPYLFNGFKINQKVVDNWKVLDFQYSDNTYKNADSVYFPPATMFIHAKDFIFPLENIILWGSGIPFALTTGAAVIFLSLKYRLKVKDKKYLPVILILFWVVYFSIYQSQLFAKYLRYFYILYPFYAILCGVFFYEIYETFKIASKSKQSSVKHFAVKRVLFKIMIISATSFSLIWTIAFVSIYSKKHPRVKASEWIYKNIPFGSNISYEHWDDALPLCLTGYPCGIGYNRIELPLYDKDTPEKWVKMSEKLESLDYLIISSNRLYGSIMTVKEIYPLTDKFYRSLFDGTLGFTKIAEFTSRPNIPFPIDLCITPGYIWYGKIARSSQTCPDKGISFVDDYADESFTVYDHPKVLIFKNENSTGRNTQLK